MFALFLSEIGFRAYYYFEHPEVFKQRGEVPAIYGLYDRSLWEFDERNGYAYPPGIKLNLTMILNGRVAGCGEVGDVNEQGNMGPSMAVHENPDRTIAVFGDSWTAFVVDGLTWPHYLQKTLQERTGKKINVYNFGRDGTGMIHMFRMAADKVPELKPDLAIVAFITDDLDRDMFWRTEVTIDGELRVLTTTVPEAEPPMNKSADTFLLHREAGRDWCERTVGRRDRVVEEIEDKYRRIILAATDGLDPAPSLTTSRHSYLYNHIVNGSATYFASRRYTVHQNPRLAVTDFREVPGFAETVRQVAETGVPLQLMHLAISGELREGREYILAENGEQLLASLESLVGQAAARTIDHVEIPGAVERIKIAEDNEHPSAFGMAFYAEAVANMIMERGLLDVPRAAASRDVSQ
ncbi:MAG: SGNH/GDSL hydrolase family protein [Sneathiellaceae bacterium]